jgi:hypothetical protein
MFSFAAVQELLIKHYKGGVMTEHIFGLKPGQELSIKGPIPKFAYKANEFEVRSFLALRRELGRWKLIVCARLSDSSREDQESPPCTRVRLLVFCREPSAGRS